MLVTLLGSLSPNRVGAHKSSLAAEALSESRQKPGRLRPEQSSPWAMTVNWFCQVARMVECVRAVSAGRVCWAHNLLAGSTH